MKTKLIIAATAAFFIAGCDYSEETKRNIVKQATEDTIETQVVLHDGREITCLVYRGYRAGGLSCDWHNTPQTK
jgi:protein involved in sex pheromone biosynthesis